MEERLQRVARELFEAWCAMGLGPTDHETWDELPKGTQGAWIEIARIAYEYGASEKD